MIRPRTHQTTEQVAGHYDELSQYYLEIWGEHVHHGLWHTGRESPDEAVRNLTRHLANKLGIQPGEQVCDIGCGYGATAGMLAQEFGAQVRAYTVSQAQWTYACANNAVSSGNPEFLLRDWMQNGLPAGAADVAISIESSEHFEDKPAFFAELARVLKPGGRAGVCAWLAAESPRAWEVRWMLEPICREGRLPGMGSERDYRALFAGAGFENVTFEDLSRRVRKTWSICIRRAAMRVAVDPEARRFLLRGPENRMFAKTMLRIWAAYVSGSMRYGLFTARRAPWPG